VKWFQQWFLFWLGALLWLREVPGAETVTLAENGRALARVVIPRDASERIQSLARELAGCLGRMSGATFEVAADDPAREAVEVRLGLDAKRTDLGPEGFELKTERRGARLSATTELGLQHAAFTLLEEMGWRRFFPDAAWEIVPRRPALRVAVRRRERPDYQYRNIWYGFGPGSEKVKSDWEAWCRHNRMGGALTVSSGHAYERLARERRAEFDAHPEYFALAGGKRKPPQFCLSNEGLARLVVDYALACFREDPARQMVSVEPADGGGHCECESCAKMGSVTDRVITLANRVAEAVQRKFPGKYIGLYAYNYHSPPPTVKVHPQVFVGIAMGFVKGDYTPDDLIAGWSGKTRQWGIREYYDVLAWSRGLPGQARAANAGYLRRTIPEWHRAGAVAMSAESSNMWGPNGPGYYVASRLLWNTRANVDVILEDFYEKAFGPAAGPMRRYYERWDASGRALHLSSHSLALAYRDLDEAARVAADDETRRRIDQLKLYAHYVRLHREWQAAREPADVLAALERLMRHTWRLGETGMVQSNGLWREWLSRAGGTRLKPGVLPADVGWQGNKLRWKDSGPLDAGQTEALFRDGLAKYKPLEFEERKFSTNLVVCAVRVEASTAGKCRYRGKRTFYVRPAAKRVTFTIASGFIPRERRTRYSLFDGTGHEVAGGALAPDQQRRDIVLPVSSATLHRLEIDDAMAGFDIEWPADARVVCRADAEQPLYAVGRAGPLYFRVPGGARQVALYCRGGDFDLTDSRGERVFAAPATPGEIFLVPVGGAGQGTVWSVRRLSCEAFFLLNVPPYLATRADQLLTPAEMR
jgi:hypothetical protein